MEAAMMGERTGVQDRLFYEFDLERMVPSDHLLRRVDAVLDLSGLRAQLAPHYSHTGRPSIASTSSPPSSPAFAALPSGSTDDFAGGGLGVWWANIVVDRF